MKKTMSLGFLMVVVLLAALSSAPVFGGSHDEDGKEGQGKAVQAPFSGAVLFGPPQVAGPYRGHKPKKFPAPALR